MDYWTSLVITILSTLASVGIGGLITFLVARRYYQKASNDLIQEASELRRYLRLLADLLDEHGYEVGRDEEGNPTGVVRKLSGTISGGGMMSGEIQVGDDANDNDS